MNYDHVNKVHEYWRETIFPNLQHHFCAASFDDYLKKFSFIPSGKWIQKLEKVKLNRIPIVVDPKQFVEKYKPYCVTYNAPVRPEDGIQRAIYQLSPTLHFEAAFWIWVEKNEVQSYVACFACYNDEKEYLKLVDDLWELRREGDTTEKMTGFSQFAGMGSAPTVLPAAKRS